MPTGINKTKADHVLQKAIYPFESRSDLVVESCVGVGSDVVT